MNPFNKYKRLKAFGLRKTGNILRISIRDKNLEFCTIVANHFRQMTDIEVIHGDLFCSKADAVVSPANSFGDMGGGVDRAIDNFYQGNAQQKARSAIIGHFLGELPVGMAHILEMESKKFPHLILAPTMRVPGKLEQTSINAYLAMRAMLVQVHLFNKRSNDSIQTIAMPGLGIGVGGMAYEQAAFQMLTAYHNIIGGRLEADRSPYAGTVQEVGKA
ncbi:MAG: macro domain-containing protein [Bacteroidota bacterium]